MPRQKTFDFEFAPGTPSVILTTSKIGPRREKTPEGFLLCRDVAIARTGWMLYGPGETPIKASDQGYALVHRDASTLFSPITVASFIGKSVTNDHPPDGVDPRNWQQVTGGTVHNVRQGTGADSDVLLADLLITDEQFIRDIEAGKVEVSAGYDADYETTGPGEGRQLNIIGNHVALVDQGRCGPRCAIGDRKPPSLKGITMAKATKTNGKPRLVVPEIVRKKVLDAMMEAANEVMQDPDTMTAMGATEDEPLGGMEGGMEGEGSHVHVHLHNGSPGPAPGMAETDDETDPAANPTAAEGSTGDPYEARFVALENGHKEILDKLNSLMGASKPAAEPAAAGTGDETDPEFDPELDDKQEGAKTADSKALERSFRQAVADAEVLVPGFQLPTFDSKAPRKMTVDSMCQLRRRVLDSVCSTQDGRLMLTSLSGRATLDLSKLDCPAVAGLYRAAAGAKKLLNNRSSTGDSGRLPTPAPQGPKQLSLADLNAMHRAAYKH